ALALHTAAAPAFAQPAASPPGEPAPAAVSPARADDAPATNAAAAGITPPVLLSPAVVPWPPGTPPRPDRVVPVIVTVGTTGAVEDARVEAGAGEPLDAAALDAARAFVFTPARD